MAHSTFHFAAGMATGIACGTPLILKAWKQAKGISKRATLWLLTAWGMGVFAEIPGILRRLGLPDHLCDAAWMNLFFFYPLVNRIKPGGQTMGPILMAMLFACQYAVLMALILRSRKPHK